MSAAREPEEIKVPKGLHEGALVGGKYRVGKPLGAGGMGLVLAAVHEALGTEVALKVIHRDSLSDPTLAARFVQEGRAAAQLKSEHVVRVHDLGTLDDGTPFLAMERLEGVDLGCLLEKKPRLSPEEAIEIVRQTCDALGEAHAVGIVHRDLKPQNLFLVQRAGKPISVKVLDFGIAKVLSAEQFQLQIATHSTAIMGSPVYMAPEQMRAAKAADTRSDLWSLGVIFYQMLAGNVPFEAESLPELCARVLTETAPPLDDALNLPPGLAEVVLRCLENDPDKRYATAEQLLEALAPFVSTRPVHVPEVSTLARALEAERAAQAPQTAPIRPDGATVPALAVNGSHEAKTVVDRGSARVRAADELKPEPAAGAGVAAARSKGNVGTTTTHRRMRKSIAQVLAENEALVNNPPAEERGNARVLLGLFLVAVAIGGGVYLYKFSEAPAAGARDGVAPAASASASARPSKPPRSTDKANAPAGSASGATWASTGPSAPAASAAPAASSRPRSHGDPYASKEFDGGGIVVIVHDAAAPEPTPSSTVPSGPPDGGAQVSE